jgi:hypothetical protein
MAMGISQADLAALIHTHQTVISYMELGQRETIPAKRHITLKPFPRIMLEMLWSLPPEKAPKIKEALEKASPLHENLQQALMVFTALTS